MASETASSAPANQGQTAPYLLVESRPRSLVAARYDRLPFPHLGPVQEVALDLGVTAMDAAIELSGVVIQGYNGHQLLVEQRWPARIIRQHTGEQDLSMAAQTGIALRSIHLLLHGYEPLTHLDITVVGKVIGAAETVQSRLQTPVRYHDGRTDLHFPLRGAWWVIQGADWSDHHKVEVFSQTYALDFVKLGADNRTFREYGTALEDHYSWDQPVYATAGGKVAYAEYDMPDLPPGVPPDDRLFRGDLRRILGNAVAISHGNGEFSYFGHLQQASLQVNAGQMIRRGALIGRVGNSGHSPGPHLHFHLMEGPNLFVDQGLPAQFSHFWAGGQFFVQPVTIPTRLIVIGEDEPAEQE